MSDVSVRNPFPPVIDGASRLLILGSMPSEATRKADFYYMNPHNRFWRVMSAILGEDFLTMSREEKTRALLAHHVALYDVVHRCSIKGSDDASIRDAEPTDVEGLLRKAPIERILLNGKKAAALFRKFFPHCGVPTVVLPSTSPANAKCSLEDLTEAWKSATVVPSRSDMDS